MQDTEPKPEYVPPPPLIKIGCDSKKQSRVKPDNTIRLINALIIGSILFVMGVVLGVVA